MADTKHHDPNPPARGPLPKRDPAPRGNGVPLTLTRGETSPQKANRKATGK
jgi:hypothetical protein